MSDAYQESALIMITVHSVANVQMVLLNTIKGNKNSSLKMKLIVEQKKSYQNEKILGMKFFPDVLTMMSVPLERINAHTNAKISMVHTCVSVPTIWCWPMISIHAFRPISVQLTTVAAPTSVMLSMKRWFAHALTELNLVTMVERVVQKIFALTTTAVVNKCVTPN